MAARANPKLVDDVKHYGASDVVKCYQCGNCSAACTISKDAHVFPRKSVHYLQMGLEKPLRSTLDPWLCYYCGECSEQCPRGAEPGETMMSLRRWLIAQYDFTGISGLFFRSWRAQLIITVVLGLLAGAGFLAYGFIWGGGDLSIYDGEKAFLPSHVVHLFDWVMGGVLFLLLAINCFRMWKFTMLNDHAPRVPLGAYVRHILLLPQHFLTQKSYGDCTKKRPWVIHMGLMMSYLVMLILIVFFLGDMQHGPEILWTHIFGYIASIGFLITLPLVIRGRLQKVEKHHQHSHHTDWFFIGLLAFVALTGIVQHIMHRTGLTTAANITYIVHLMGVVSFEVTQVPFGKWSHMAYRPLAIYFAQLQDAAKAEATVPLGAPAKPQPVA
jgi:ferredoxin